MSLVSQLTMPLCDCSLGKQREPLSSIGEDLPVTDLIFVDESDYYSDSEHSRDDISPVSPPGMQRSISLRPEESQEEYDELERLGTGKFGVVTRCRAKQTEREFAAKHIRIRKLAERNLVEHEISILSRLCHPLIVQLFEAFSPRPNRVVLIMELVEGGELFERIADDAYVITEKAVVVFMRQICEALEYIHSQGIVHLDMKPENILCLSRTGNRIKIIDFGLSQEYKPGDDLRIIAGTPEFAAPEIVNFDSVDFATDMWSVGVMTYILLTGLSPFLGDNDNETYSNVTAGDWDFSAEEFGEVSEEAKDFISKLLIYKKNKRMSASDCLKHEWLRRPNENELHHKENFRQYVTRRRWKKGFHVVRAISRMGFQWNFDSPKTKVVE